jgi:hypothetical protein
MEETTMNANLMTKKIEMSKKEAKAAGKIGTPEFEELKNYLKEYPNFEIQIKAPAKRKVEFRGLDYNYMRTYIQKHDDEDGKIMAEFRALIAQDKKDKVEGSEYLEAAGYLEVKKWFLAKFPEIKNYKEEHQKKIEKILAAA